MAEMRQAIPNQVVHPNSRAAIEPQPQPSPQGLLETTVTPTVVGAPEETPTPTHQVLQQAALNGFGHLNHELV